jgi:Cu/Ag efflux pump CusA
MLRCENLGIALSQRTFLRCLIFLLFVCWLLAFGLLSVQLTNIINLALALVGGGWPFALVGHF